MLGLDFNPVAKIQCKAHKMPTVLVKDVIMYFRQSYARCTISEKNLETATSFFVKLLESVLQANLNLGDKKLYAVQI